MSQALSLTTLSRNVQTLDAKRWITISEATKRLRINAAHLARRCKNDLSPKGLAVMATPERGGRPCWHINRTLDMCLAFGPLGEVNQSPTLGEYSDDQRRDANERAACVKALRHARVNWPGNMSDWIPQLIDDLTRQHKTIKISRASLYKWDKLYRGRADLFRLIDDRGGNRRGEATPSAWSLFRDLFLHENQPTIRACWREVRAQSKVEDWTWLTYTQCRRQLDGKIPPMVQTKYRQPADYRRGIASYIEQDAEHWKAGLCWEGDHRQSNVIVKFGPRQKLIRPWLTSWMDRRSRRIVGWCISDSPNSTTILAAMRHGLTQAVNCGGPDVVWIDNGKDYDARTFHGQSKAERKSKISLSVDESQVQGLFNRLGIEPHFSLPYNPNGKSHLERWHDTLEDFDKRFETYTGRGISDKPERLNDVLKNHPHKVPTFEVYRDRLASHITGYNAMTGQERESDHMHEMLDGLSPDQFLLDRCPRKRPLPTSADLDMLMQHHHKPVRVSRNGISIIVGGRRKSYGNHAQILTPLRPGKGKKGQIVNVSYDPQNTDKVLIWTERWQFIGELPVNGVGGHTGDPTREAEDRALMRDKAVYERSLKVVRNNQITQLLSDQEQIAHTRQMDDATIKKELADKPLKMVPIPGEGAAKQLNDQQLLMAAGAEDISLAEPLDLSPPGSLAPGSFQNGFSGEAGGAGGASGGGSLGTLSDFSDPATSGNASGGGGDSFRLSDLSTFDNDGNHDLDDSDGMDAFDLTRQPTSTDDVGPHILDLL